MQNNTEAVRTLKDMGYPMSNIRKALPRLTGIQIKEVVKKIGYSRQLVTLTLQGRRDTKGPQEKIARVFDIPRELLFEDIIEKKDRKLIEKIQNKENIKSFFNEQIKEDRPD